MPPSCSALRLPASALRLALTALACPLAGGALSAEETPAKPVPGPLFVWENALANNQVVLPNRPRPRATSLATLTGRAHFGVFSRMEADHGSFFADFASSARIRENLSAGQGFTLELVATPRSIAPDTGGTVAAVQAPGHPPVLLLAQTGDRLHAGDPAASAGPLVAGRPQHLALRASADRLDLFLDGRLATSTPRSTTPVSEQTSLVFGAAADGSSDWRGTIEAVAWHPHPITDDKLRASAEARLATLAGRAEPTPFTLQATLLEKSEPAEASSYPRSLVAYRYRVEPSPDSPVHSTHVVIYHWGVLGGQSLPIVNVPLNTTRTLRLLPLDAVPILEKEHRSEEVFDPEAETYYALPDSE